jgi:DNA-binding NarL/FixJ family response regulator
MPHWPLLPGDGDEIPVLIVDDHALVRAGLGALLRAAPGIEVVGEAADGEQAIALAATTHPRVVLMDIRMPGIGGIAATRQILASAADPPPRILILTTFGMDQYVYDALRAGAAGFMLKDTSPDRLVAAIATVAAGDVLLSSAAWCCMVEAYGSRFDASAPPRKLDALTGRELEVLRLVGQGRSNADIAELLVIAEATVKTHINRVLAKLGLSSRAQAVVIAYESGLISPQRTGARDRHGA